MYAEYGLKPGEAQKVASEIEAHNGLFIQAGFDTFEFAHKSLQEFLTAEYIVKLPRIPDDLESVERLPNELAIAVAISSSPTNYLSELVLTSLKPHKLPIEFVRIFSGRLLAERPDFKSTQKLEMALITLYSYFIEAVALYSKSNSLDSDVIFIQLEKLIASHYRRSEVGRVMRSYESTRMYHTDRKIPVHRLTLNKEKLHSRLSVEPEALPVNLFLRDSIYRKSMDSDVDK
jgi:hypothetical protein